MMLVNVQYSHCEVLYNQFFFFWTHNKRGMVIKCIKGELLLLVNEQQWSEKRSLQLHLFQMRQFLQILPPQNFYFISFCQRDWFLFEKIHTLHWIWKKGVKAVAKVDIFFVTACHPSSSKSPIVIPKVALLSGHLTYNRQVVICAHLCRSRSEDPINW